MVSFGDVLVAVILRFVERISQWVARMRADGIANPPYGTASVQLRGP